MTPEQRAILTLNAIRNLPTLPKELKADVNSAIAALARRKE